jgi:glucose/arabinose dehydrogenase
MRTFILLFAITTLIAGEVKEVKHPPQGQAMPFGPVVHYFVELPAHGAQPVQTVTKAVAVQLGADAGALFDSETLRYAAWWHGGFVDMTGTNVTRWVQGAGGPKLVGTVVAGTAMGPGVAAPTGTSWSDPRPDGIGNLPAAWGAYLGSYRHGTRTVLHYRIGTSEVLDAPDAVAVSGTTVFTRTLRVGAGAALTLLVAEVAGATGAIAPGMPTAMKTEDAGDAAAFAWLDRALVADARTAVRVVGAPATARLHLRAGRITLALPARTAATTFTIALTTGADAATLATALAGIAVPGDPSSLTTGGPVQWPRLTTSGRRGADTGPYAVDTIALPGDNPWRSWLRPIAHDFFSDGRLALSTMGGDVWIASGIDDTLEKITWKRFATGLFEPLGLKIVADRVYVSCRDALTRLDDLNGDGEADAYVAFNRDVPVWAKYNDFTMDLVTDEAGNFYTAKGAHGSPVGYPRHSTIIKISADGTLSEDVGAGLRVPSGIGMGPGDLLTFADNQGNWVPVCKISVVRPGRWYGYVGSPQFYGKDVPAHPATYEPPLCWMPMSADNCPGSQVWAGDQWGPLSHALLHLSYGQSTILAVLPEKVGDTWQGGVVTLPLKFASGIMRARVNPTDGQLYVSGLKGWQTNASVDGCLQRVRWTGNEAAWPIGLSVKRGEVHLRFSAPLDPDSVNAEGVSGERWNYAWTGAYGSADLSFADPQKKGRDRVIIDSVRLAADQRTVVIAIPDLKPVMQQALTVKFADAKGDLVKFTLYQTINVVP